MNQEYIKDKIIFISGSAKGLGAEIAKVFAQKGAQVIIHYRNSRKEAEEVLKEVQKHSPNSFIVSGDLTKKEDVEELFQEIYQRVSNIDVLINTIGDFIYKPIGKASFEEFRNVLESNLYSTFLCSKAVLPKMREKRKGAIINFGSVGCERILLRPNTTPYYIAKTGIYMLTKLMAFEEATYGIRINMISPGALPTSIVKPDEFPSGRATEFSDIIKAIMFLLSNDASYIMGANLEVSGGWSPEL